MPGSGGNIYISENLQGSCHKVSKSRKLTCKKESYDLHIFD